MEQSESDRHEGAPVWGAFLVFLGIVLLLQALGILSWSLWGTLWRFWPALIIITGLGILLRNWNHWLVTLLVLAILGVCLGVAMWQFGHTTMGVF